MIKNRFVRQLIQVKKVVNQNKKKNQKNPKNQINQKNQISQLVINMKEKLKIINLMEKENI